MLSCVQLFAIPWARALQVPLSMESSKQEDWSGLPFPTPGNLPNPETEFVSLTSPELQAGSLPLHQYIMKWSLDSLTFPH